MMSRLTSVRIRAAQVADSEAIRDVERSAGQRFREIGMEWVASHEPMNAEKLGSYADHGRSWVAQDELLRPVGYVIAEIVDDCAHIEQLSVAFEHQGKGIGRALVEAVEAWAVASGLGGVTLTTFRDVGWNRPLYEHLGFSVLDQGELSEGLVEKREDEALLGLERSPRVAMRKEFGPAP